MGRGECQTVRNFQRGRGLSPDFTFREDCRPMATLSNGTRATAGQYHLESTSQGHTTSPDHPHGGKDEENNSHSRAGGGEGGNGGEERLHPVLPNHIYHQIQEDREYLTLWGNLTNVNLSDRMNALYEMGYEIEHTTRDRYDNFVLIFRKIGDPEEPPP